MSRPRRDALKIIGAIGVNCAFPFSADELYAQHAHGNPVHQIRPLAAPYKPQFFDQRQYAVISRIADLIVPPTDSPGAVAAGVPEYIDRVVHASPDQQKRFAAGFAWIEKQAGKPFLELSEERQIALLTPLCDAADSGRMKHAGDRFFKAMKSMTADGYYTSQAGLVKELGYSGNTVRAAYPECTHPEHKA